MLAGIRVLSVFICLVIGALLASALVNYPLYNSFPWLASSGPHKLINTTAKLLLIPGFILLLRYYHLNSRQALGYGLKRSNFIREMLLGLLMGMAILSILSALLILLDIRQLKPVGNDFGYVLAKALVGGLLGGILIGFIEETFFRGALFGALRQKSSFLITLLLSSLLYASMHFIRPMSLDNGEVFSWLSGMLILSGSFDQFTSWTTFDSFLGLFAVGVYFALVRERTGNIAYVVGLHAGFVFVIKVIRKLTVVDSQEPLSLLVGSYDGMVGYLSAAGMLIHVLLTYFFWRRPHSVQAGI